MAARVSAWRDPASEQQVARWFAEQEALGRGGKHANVLEKTGVVRKPQLPKRPQSARPVMGGGNAEAAAARSKRPQSAHPSRKPALPSQPENSAAGPAIEVKATKATIDEPVKMPQRPKSAHPSSKSRSYSMKELLGDEAGDDEEYTVSYGGMEGVRSNYQEYYNAMDEHKDVFEDMVKVCRPHPVENQTFTSEWGDTTKTGDMKAWAKSMLKTHNQCVNEHAATQNADLIKQNRERFHKDVRRKQLYYADLLSDGAAADVDEYLKNASYEDKEEFLSAFRDMHAGSAEHRNRQTSVTQEKFKQGYRPSSADGARVKEFSDNKQKLRGPTIHPRELDKLKAAKERRMAKEAAEVAARKEAFDAKLRAIAAKKGTSAELFPEKRISARPDTFDSGFTLGWVGTDPGETNQSAYQEHHGGNYAEILKDLARGKEEKAFASTANNYNNITAPYGEVNYLNQEEPDKCYPVAKNFFQSKPHYEKLCQQELRTTNRSAFPVRARNEGLAQAESALKAAAAARAMRTKSSVPLGRQGIMDHPRHQRKTTYKSEFVRYEDAGPQMGKPSITAHS